MRPAFPQTCTDMRPFIPHSPWLVSELPPGSRTFTSRNEDGGPIHNYEENVTRAMVMADSTCGATHDRQRNRQETATDNHGLQYLWKRGRPSRRLDSMGWQEPAMGARRDFRCGVLQQVRRRVLYSGKGHLDAKFGRDSEATGNRGNQPNICSKRALRNLASPLVPGLKFSTLNSTSFIDDRENNSKNFLVDTISPGRAK